FLIVLQSAVVDGYARTAAPNRRGRSLPTLPRLRHDETARRSARGATESRARTPEPAHHPLRRLRRARIEPSQPHERRLIGGPFVQRGDELLVSSQLLSHPAAPPSRRR